MSAARLDQVAQVAGTHLEVFAMRVRAPVADEGPELPPQQIRGYPHCVFLVVAGEPPAKFRAWFPVIAGAASL
ncbi:hypothetical protein CKO27_10915 [Thiocystis violacea]|nr:hypothetical protein [Thiocystis violacea]